MGRHNLSRSELGDADDADASNLVGQFSTRARRRIGVERVKRFARTGRLPITTHEGRFGHLCFRDRAVETLVTGERMRREGE
jgi:hypothetical protein